MFGNIFLSVTAILNINVTNANRKYIEIIKPEASKNY